MVTTAPLLTKTQVIDAINASLALPYEPEPGSAYDERFRGMTNLEVMMHKRAQAAARSGSIDGSETLLDRVIGKPIAKSESLRVDASYTDYLKSIATKVVGGVARAEPIMDAEVVPSTAQPKDPLTP